MEILSAFSGALHDEGVHLRLIRAVGAKVADRHSGLHHQKRIVRERRHRILALAILLLRFGRLLKNNFKKQINQKQSKSSKLKSPVFAFVADDVPVGVRGRERCNYTRGRKIRTSKSYKNSNLPNGIFNSKSFLIMLYDFCEDFCEDLCEDSRSGMV